MTEQQQQQPQSFELVVLLDRSGSMASIRKDMEGGFNNLIAEQRQVPGECVVTLVQFDTDGIDTVYEARPIAEVPPLQLQPRGGTPLLDAMGRTLTRTKERFAKAAKKPDQVIFLVITDGEENSSREFKKDQIKALVLQGTNDDKWTFSFLGANVDAFAEAGSLGIPMAGVAGYSANAKGVGAAFAAVSRSLGSSRSTGKRYELDDEQRRNMNVPDDPKAS